MAKSLILFCLLFIVVCRIVASLPTYYDNSSESNNILTANGGNRESPRPTNDCNQLCQILNQLTAVCNELTLVKSQQTIVIVILVLVALLDLFVIVLTLFNQTRLLNVRPKTDIESNKESREGDNHTVDTDTQPTKNKKKIEEVANESASFETPRTAPRYAHSRAPSTVSNNHNVLRFLKSLDDARSVRSSRSGTPFSPAMNRLQCVASTQKGGQCRNAAAPGEDMCRVHLRAKR